ncbi:TonB C-terminal domain-containing protein [Burkholderia cepacia]|uniref:TonB C-terminal domain-containing protein n=1 Tax=Burkholderia cepacia TaxID=292 RepID=UPI0012DAB6D3|nr:TonB C-terminal domain-containing protein [Burkholderia cepacia]
MNPKSIVLAAASLAACAPAVAQETSAITPLKSASPLSRLAIAPAMAAVPAIRLVAPRKLNLHIDWSARPAGAGDNVSVIAHVDEHGNVLDAAIDQSSGDVQWDETCVTAVRSSSPLPTPAANSVHGGPYKIIMKLHAPRDPSLSPGVSAQSTGDNEKLSDMLARRPDISTHSHITYSPRIVVGERAALQPPMSEFHFAGH